MATGAPIRLRQGEIERIVRSFYGLEASASELPGYSGQNALVEVAGGGRFVLKIASQDESGEGLDLQNRALDHLARARGDLLLKTPEVFRNLAGEAITPFETDDGTPLRARMLTYVPGRLWMELDQPSAELLRDLGKALGRLDRSLATFSHPHAGRDLEWDLRNAERQRQFLDSVVDRERREQVDRVFHLFAACVAPRFGDLRRSVIQGDPNDQNLLTDEEATRTTGLLDFGDLVESHRIFEPAIAIAYALLRRRDDAAGMIRAGAEVLSGYHRELPLNEVEVEVLFPSICARLGVSVVNAARRRAEGRTEEYFFVTEEPAWEVLAKLVEIDPEEALAVFGEVCGLEKRCSPAAPRELAERRRRRIGPSLSLSFESPLKIVRGSGQYLYDHRGRPYLDLVNNVCHVGHCHPRVVEAGSRQMALLNTNTRYLYDGLTDYADRLCATLPEPLSVCYFVCSGSEANELALRLARAHTGRRDMLVLDGAYHGHTSALIDLSPYKFLGAGGRGEPEPWVHIVPVPDGYRGIHKGFGPEAGAAFAEEVRGVIESSEGAVAGFIGEPFLGCGGQIIPPEGYLAGVYRHVREAGGVCIADEVQVGFGRAGTHFWAFETQGVVPDIVVLGKPIGNGHPMSAVITTREIAESFANGMEFFSTFGGNPVSCAIGTAVLDVVEEERLQAWAGELGGRFLRGLRELGERHSLIGDVRGRGLFLGVELVRDRESLEPADREATEIVEAMKRRGILLSIDGPLHNVLKIKPPMVLGAGDVDFTIRCLDFVLERFA